ncbi:MAG: phenylacetate--CoA ligase family protein, partial [Planctomycetes bacterium]|nr:phenylacetate--CoA ligase family protein [Planctomycetota bacterium]
ELCCPEVPGGLIASCTGGSTGEPVKFYLDRRRQAYDKAARMRTHEWFGVHPGDKEIYLWGSPWEVRRQDRLRSLRDRLTNERLLSAFDLSEETMARYLRVIDRYRPVSIFGYPSSLVLLCEFASRQRLHRPPPSLRAVFVTGEVCDEHQRRTLESYFQVPVANGYGSREAGFIAHECPSGTMHVTDENVIVEIVDPAADSAPAGEPVVAVPRGRLGEIVVTHLDNYGMPMIRYRTGDLGRRADTICSCGRALTALDAIQGRKTDHLVASDGSLTHGLSLIYVLREMDRVRQFQIHQRADLDLLIRIVADPGFNGRHHEGLIRATREQLGPGVGVRIEQVDRIDASASGKHRCVTSDAFAALPGGSAASGAEQP